MSDGAVDAASDPAVSERAPEPTPAGGLAAARRPRFLARGAGPGQDHGASWWPFGSPRAALRLRRGRAAPSPPAVPAPLTAEQIIAAEPGRGRAARAPWQIPALGWKDIAWRTYRGVSSNRLPALAGGVTFYVLLASFPAIAAFVSLYGLFSDVNSVERQLGGVAAFVPRDAVSLVAHQMIRLTTQRHATLSVAFGVSTLLSIWSANAGMKALFDGLNIVYDEPEKRPYLRRTLITYAATLGGLAFLTASAAVTVAAPLLFHAVGLHSLRYWWTPLRWVGVYLTTGGVFALLYRVGPSRRDARWPWVCFGGFAAALLWMVGSLAFSFYVDRFTHWGVTFGSLSTLVGFMLWVWVSVMILLMGAEFNAEIEHQTTVDTTVGPAGSMGKRGAVMADTVGEAFTVSPRQARHIVRDFLRRQIDYVLSALRGLIGR